MDFFSFFLNQWNANDTMHITITCWTIDPVYIVIPGSYHEEGLT